MHYTAAAVGFSALNAEVWVVLGYRFGRKYTGAQIAYASVTSATLLAFLVTDAGWFEITNLSLVVLASNWLSVDHDEVITVSSEERPPAGTASPSLTRYLVARPRSAR